MKTRDPTQSLQQKLNEAKNAEKKPKKDVELQMKMQNAKSIISKMSLKRPLQIRKKDLNILSKLFSILLEGSNTSPKMSPTLKFGHQNHFSIHELYFSQFNNEVTSIEELGYIAQSAIQTGRPLEKPFYLKDQFRIDLDQHLKTMSPVPPRSPPEIENLLLKLYNDLRLSGMDSLPLSLAEAQVLATDLSVKQKVVDYAVGDWRVILFAAINLNPHIEMGIRRVTDQTTDPNDEIMIQVKYTDYFRGYIYTYSVFALAIVNK